MVFNWNAESERNLLLLVITTSETKLDTAAWTAIADKLGGGFNGNAASQRFHKLKRESEKVINGSEAANPATGNGKSSKAIKTATAKTGGKRKVADASSGNEPDPAPPKKSKKEATTKTEENENSD